MSQLTQVISASRRRVSFDADAADYFARIVTAGSAISAANKTAINAFIVGCKADGIWTAIKASCILAGADDLTGALVPLVGTAPTNVSFVSGDYSRTTGLLGNGSSKYLNSNRANNADPEYSKHMACWRTTSEDRAATRAAMATPTETGYSQLLTTTSQRFFRNNGKDISLTETTATAGIFATSRSDVSTWTERYAGATYSATESGGGAVSSSSIQVFARNAANFSNARISYYSIGEHLDLALLDARLTTLMAALT